MTNLKQQLIEIYKGKNTDQWDIQNEEVDVRDSYELNDNISVTIDPDDAQSLDEVEVFFIHKQIVSTESTSFKRK